MLQEDLAGETLQVLRQIAQQTATYQLLPSGVLNTTATISPSSSTPFQPSHGALRVNILWFASLVFSLSTASIGLLVKQWLHAYTTYQTSSAQGRMRIRHFRRQGLETWKVYEIAAMLPLLIQLALGLFFVGLCYFTAEVHPDLGHTTLPLVAGWALFIFAVTILPLISAHCPYKPASYEGVLSILRRRLFSLIATCQFYDGLALWAVKRTPNCAEGDRPYDEADAVKYADKDVGILVSADALQSDDELLGTAILDALKQSQLNLKQVVTFLLGSLQSRIPWDTRFQVEDEPTLLDCRSLTLRARMATTDILTQIPSDQIVPYLNDIIYGPHPMDNEMCWALCILLSPSQYLISAAGLRFLGVCLTHDMASRFVVVNYVRLQLPKRHDMTLPMLLQALRHICLEKKVALDSAVQYTREVLVDYFLDANLPDAYFIAAIDETGYRTDQPSIWTKFLNNSTLGETVDWLSEHLGRELQSQNSTSAAVLKDAVSLIFRLSATIAFSTPTKSAEALRNVITHTFTLRGRSSEHLELIIWSYICQPGVYLDSADPWVLGHKLILPENAIDIEGSSSRSFAPHS